MNARCKHKKEIIENELQNTKGVLVCYKTNGENTQQSVSGLISINCLRKKNDEWSISLFTHLYFDMSSCIDLLHTT